MDEEERNFCSLILLLLRVGNTKLRLYFKNEWDSTPRYTPWTDSPHNGADLVRLRNPKILSYEQTKVNSGDTSTWDISLMVKILLKTSPPFVSKPNIRKALEDLKGVRNSLSHSSAVRIKTCDFNKMWERCCNVLTIFGAKSEDFKKVKKDVKKPWQELNSILKKWAAEDKMILDNLQQIQGKLGQLQEGQATLHKGMEKLEDRLKETHSTLHQGQNRIEGMLKENQEGQMVLQEMISNKTKMAPDFDMQDVISQICSLHQETLQRNNSSTEQENCAGLELANFLKRYYKEGERALILPFPWMEGDRYHIQNLCTSTKIIDKDEGNDNVPLQNLFSSVQGKEVKRILIEGVPGIGKSTFCKKFAYDWSGNKMPVSDSFPKFDLVLVVKCRDLRNGDLWESIEDQNLPDELREKKADVFRYIRNNQDKILVIIEGYDEVPVDTDDHRMEQSIMDLISGKLLSQCRVIVTSRPEKVLEIRKHFDRKLEIQGFGSWIDSCSFIKRFFSSSPKTAEDAILSIETIAAVRDLLRSPLNAAFLCLVFEERKECKDVFRTLDLCSLYHEIVFCVTKRYCKEKQGKPVRDDSMMSHFHDIYVQLGKIALDLMNRNKNYFEEQQLGDDSKQVIIRNLGFVTEQKPFNKIRTESLYSFTHSSIKEYFAAIYVAESLSKGDIDTLISILGFTASPLATPVDNSHHVQNIYYSLQRFNLVRMLRLADIGCAVQLISGLLSRLSVDANEFRSEVVKFDFMFCFICELLGSLSDDQVGDVLSQITLPDVPFIFYAYNGELAIKGLTSLLSYSIDESSRLKIKALRMEGLQVVSTWVDTMEELSRALGAHPFLETLSLSFFSSFEDISVFFSHFSSTTLKSLSLSYIQQESSSLEDLEFNPLGNILNSFPALVHVSLTNSPISEACCYGIAFCPALRVLELCNCNVPVGHLRTLLDALKANHCLEKLDLSGSMIDSSLGFDLRNYILKENQTLQILNLSYCCLDSECISCIFDAIAVSRSLLALDLSGNKLDDLLCSYVGRILSDNHTLRVLNLSHCGLNSDCICYVFEALAANHSLTEIDLSGSSIDDWLCPYAKKILIENQSLQILKLSHCTLGSEFILYILNVLATDCSLKEIDLSEIKIVYQDSPSLVQSLTLQEFLSNVSSPDGSQTSRDFNVYVREVEHILRENQKLKVFRLRRCNLYHNSVTSILDALSANQALTEIDLTDNEISNSNRKMIAHMKTSKPDLAILC